MAIDFRPWYMVFPLFNTISTLRSAALALSTHFLIMLIGGERRNQPQSELRQRRAIIGLKKKIHGEDTKNAKFIPGFPYALVSWR